MCPYVSQVLLHTQWLPPRRPRCPQSSQNNQHQVVSRRRADRRENRRKPTKEVWHLRRHLRCQYSLFSVFAHLLIMGSTEHNCATSPLLRLPGEIRNQIYRQLVEGYASAEPWWRSSTIRRGSNIDWMHARRWVECYSLTAICRDIRAEFGSFLTSMGQIRFWRPLHLYRWAKSASESAKSGIKTVRIVVLAGNCAPTLRKYMAALRTLPDIERVVVQNCRSDTMLKRLADLMEIAVRQGGRWKVVVKE